VTYWFAWRIILANIYLYLYNESICHTLVIPHTFHLILISFFNGNVSFRYFIEMIGWKEKHTQDCSCSWLYQWCPFSSLLNLFIQNGTYGFKLQITICLTIFTWN
jgi:hypothetical protein